jgi:hypothetical protein
VNIFKHPAPISKSHDELRTMRHAALLTALIVAFAFSIAGAETFRLKPGCEIDGKSEVAGKVVGKSGTKLIIKTEQGGTVIIEESSIAERVAEDPAGGESADTPKASSSGLTAPLAFEPLIVPDSTLKMTIEDARSAAVAFPDQVMLLDGGRVAGKVTREEGVIKVASAYGARTFKESEVKEIQPGPDSVFQTRLKALADDSAAGWVELGDWCISQKSLTNWRQKAVMCLQHALAIAPEDATARGLLGYEMVDRAWLRSDDLAEAKGFVRLNGRWASPEAAFLTELGDKISSWKDIGELSYGAAVRRAEDIFDTAKVEFTSGGKRSFSPYRDECAALVTKEKMEWTVAPKESRIGKLTDYARNYGRLPLRERRIQRQAAMDYEARDVADLSACPDCGGQPGMKETKRCESCRGTGVSQQACGTCKGKGQSVCSKCRASGKVDCGNCANGLVASGNRLVRCAVCKDGRIPCSVCAQTGKLMCKNCEGMGTLSGKVCKTCEGAGMVKTTKACPKCSGTGRIHMTAGFHR